MFSQEIIIEAEPWEERVAVRQAGTLTEFLLERPDERPRVGSIYKGKVATLLNSVGAAIVDIGEGDPAFLPLRDPGTGELEPVSRGEPLLVQVTKRPMAGKKAQVTQQVSLPGRHLVLMPKVPVVKISRRIEEEGERLRLEEIMGKIRPDNCGLVARTAVLGKDAGVLRSGLDFLMAEWEEIARRFESSPAPSLLREEVPLRVRALRDLCGPYVERIRISPRPRGIELLDFARSRFPDVAGMIEVEEDGLFWRLGIEVELEQVFESRIYLKSGGSLVFDFTEALTVVDVNSGHPFEEGSVEEIALRTNMEAAQEIPRQLKLRGIGGIIVVDFIDMLNPEHQKQMMGVLESALREDRVKTQVAMLSPFGVVEMTRKRVAETPYHELTEPCPSCAGRGRTLSPATLGIFLARRITRMMKEGGRPPFKVRVNPRLGRSLREDGRIVRAVLKDSIGEIAIEDDASLSYEDFKVFSASQS